MVRVFQEDAIKGFISRQALCDIIRYKRYNYISLPSIMDVNYGRKSHLRSHALCFKEVAY